MKKLAIGCFVVLLVAAVAGGGIVYFKVIKPGMQMAGTFIELGEQFRELDRQIENRRPWDPPEGTELTEAQLGRFLSAQRLIRERLAGRLDELNRKYKTIEQELKASGGQAGIREILGAYGDLGTLLLEAKKAQVEALNAQQFSPEEYAWVRNRVYAALGQPVAQLDLSGASTGEAGWPSVSEQTRALVEPHREELLEMAPIAWFGL
ncbi:MAG: hypothetical protein Kow0020_00160 [Wenzhouxiangellaceae bacterium]